MFSAEDSRGGGGRDGGGRVGAGRTARRLPHPIGGPRRSPGVATTTGSWATPAPADSTVPVVVDTAGVLAGQTVTAISAGNCQSCAVADGKAYCWGGTTARAVGQHQRPPTRGVPVAGGHRRGAGRPHGHRDQRRGFPLVCGGRRPGLLLGLQQSRAVGQQQHHQLQRAGRGGHRRGAERQDGHRDQRRDWPHVCGGRRQGLLLGLQRLTGSWATTPPSTRACRSR